MNALLGSILVNIFVISTAIRAGVITSRDSGLVLYPTHSFHFSRKRYLHYSAGLLACDQF